MITCFFENNNKADPGLRHAVTDALVVRDNKILLSRRSEKLFAEPGKWAIPGGFISRDEKVSQTVVREVLEETGYKVKDAKLFAINDNTDQPGNDRQNIVFIYICEIGEKTGNPDWEVSDVKWFDLDNLPESRKIAFDHLEIIDLYKKYREENFNLPYFE